MLDFLKVESRLKMLLDIEKDKHLAYELGIKQVNYGTLKHIEKIPFEQIISLCNRKGLDLNYIFKI